MSKKPKSSFEQSELARKQTKSHLARTFIKHVTQSGNIPMGTASNRTGSATVVRIIIGLILLHLIIIGGVLMRGKMIAETAPGIAPSLAQPPTAAPTPVLPQPEDGPIANPVRATGTHITQSALPSMADDDTAEEEEEPAIVTPPTLTQAPEPAPTPSTVIAKHHVASGETLYGIAAKYHVTIDAICAANPKMRGKTIVAGSYLNIPVSSQSEAGRAAAAATPATPAVKKYTIQRNDTLARIAKKHGISTAKLMKLNNLTDKDARRIKPGETLIISE